MKLPARFTPEIGAECRRFFGSTAGQLYLEALRLNRPAHEKQDKFEASALQSERIGGYEDCMQVAQDLLDFNISQNAAEDVLPHIDPRRFTSKVMPHAQKQQPA